MSKDAARKVAARKGLKRLMESLVGSRFPDAVSTLTEYGPESYSFWWETLCNAIIDRNIVLVRILLTASVPLTPDEPLEDACWRNALEPAPVDSATDSHQMLVSRAAANLRASSEAVPHQADGSDRDSDSEPHSQKPGADGGIAEGAGRTPRLAAVQHRPVDYVESLVAGGADEYATDEEVHSANYGCLGGEDWDALGLLLHEKAEKAERAKLSRYNVVGKAINSLTMEYIDNIIAAVAKAGLPCSVFPGDRKNALFESVRRGNTENLEKMLRKASMLSLVRDINNQITPLHVAVFYGKKDAAELLIINGANVLAEDAYGRTSIDYITSLNKPEMLLVFLKLKPCFLDHFMRSTVRTHRVDLLRIVLDHGGNVFVRFSDGRSLLEHANSSYNTELVETLLKNGADANEIVSDGKLIHRSKCSRVAVLLLEYGAYLNSPDSHGETLLVVQHQSKSSYNILISRHFIRMKVAAGFPICESILAHHSQQMRCPEVFVAACEAEVADLKEERVDTGTFCVSLFDVLKADIHRMAQFARNETLFRALSEKVEPKRKFPNYGGMIRAKLSMGKTRLSFLQKGSKALSIAMPNLPSLCIQHILSNLSNKDVQNCCIASNVTK